MPRKKVNLDAPPKNPVRPSASQPAGGDASAPPKRRAPQRRDEVADLRRRAAAAATDSKSVVTTSVRFPLPVYRALVELAEEYHEPIARVIAHCIEDGIRKYKDFSTPGFAPFRPSVARAAVAVRQTPGLLTSIRNLPQFNSVPLPDVDEDEEAQARTQLNMETIAASGMPLGALLPSSPPLKEIYRPDEDDDEAQ